jgi:hypothetical protein
LYQTPYSVVAGFVFSRQIGLDMMSLRGMLYVTVLNLYISKHGHLFGTAMYVDYLTFSHLNPITNPTPLPNATLTIGATASKPN